jgi:hypothetical protein
MRSAIPVLAAAAALLMPACSREEEPGAHRFERQKAEIENKASALEAQVENEVSAVEGQLQKDADALLQNQSGDNEVAVNETETAANSGT